MALVVRAADDAGRRRPAAGAARGVARSAERAGGVIVGVSSVRSGGSESRHRWPAFSAVSAAVDKRLRAASIRRSDSSRPSSLSGLENPGRDGGPGERDADRLVDLPRLRPRAAPTRPAARFPGLRRSTAPGTSASAARACSSRSSASGEPSDLLARGGVIGRPVEEKAARAARTRPAWRSSPARSAAAPRSPSRPVSASSRAVRSSSASSRR